MDFQLKDERGAASLPICEDADTWWREWGPKIAARHGKAGWILFLLDAAAKLQEVEMLLSRVLRNKPTYGTGGTEKEWLNVADQAAEVLAWYEQTAPGPMRDAPEWAKYLFLAQYTNLTVTARIARELRAVQEQGYLVATVERAPDSVKWNADAVEVAMREAD